MVCPLSEEAQELQLRSTEDGSLFYCRKTNLQPDQSRYVYVENALFSGIGNRVLFLENTNEVEKDPKKHIEEMIPASAVRSLLSSFGSSDNEAGAVFDPGQTDL